MKKKSYFISAVMVIAVLVLSVFAQSVEIDSNATSEYIQKNVKNLFVKKFVEEQEEISEENVKDVRPVDLDQLPDEITIKDIKDTNVAIYEVNYEENSSNVAENKKVYVLTYSTEQFEAPQEASTEKVQYLYFTDAEDSDNSRFLMINGVRGSKELGYVMLDKGSITGLSTALEITNSSEGNIDIIIYKNGEDTGFRNSVDASQTGVGKDFDLQSQGIINFEPGDVISVYASSNSGASWSNVITTLKVTTEPKE